MKCRKYLSAVKYWYYLNRVSVNYIVSTGRTGTNFFESFLNAASDKVFCVHEPAPDLFDIALEKVRNKKDINYLSEKILQVRKKYIYQTVSNGKSVFIESNPNASFLLPEVKKAFPRSKFIIITRDPRTYLPSALNKSPQGNGVLNFYGETDKRKRVKADDFDNEEFGNTWGTLTRMEKIGWYWNKCNEVLFEYYTKNKDHVQLLKYEDIFSSDDDLRRKSLKAILEFFKIPMKDQNFEELFKLSYSRTNSTMAGLKAVKNFNLWGQHEKTVLLSITEKMRVKLGY